MNDISTPAEALAPLAAAFERQARRRQETRGYQERIESLRALEGLLRDNVGAFSDAIRDDFGARSAHETRLLEVFPSLETIAHARRHLRGWMRPQRRATSRWFLTGRSRVLFQPLGVVGILVPWNYPVYLAIAPLAGALAAGNRAIVKMSEVAPRTGALFEKLVSQRFDPSVLAVVNGGPELGRAFSRLPFDRLLFTGSTEVGREVMRAASENLTPVTLELGGKSPALVGRGIAIEAAAERIVFGKCLNAGQTCIAPDYALVPEERIDAFVASAQRAVAAFYPTLRDNPDYSAIVNARHRDRLRGYVEEAVRHGAHVVELNPAAEDFEGSPKMPPRLLLGVRLDDRVMREEIFGPILPVIGYRTLDEAIAFVNARPRPLALYVFDHDRDAVERVLGETTSGGVTVNETLLHVAQDDLPFGGVGPSGMGEYHGREGFESFSKRKAVFHAPRVSGLKWLRPPYGRRFEALARFLVR